MWRLSLKTFQTYSSMSVHVWHTQVRCKGVLCCIFTNTGNLSNFPYGASPVTVDAILRGFHYSAMFVLRPPTRCIIRATMPIICNCSWNNLVALCWFLLAKHVDRHQSLNSWYVRRVFVWRRHFLLNTSCDGVLLSWVSLLFFNSATCL